MRVTWREVEEEVRGRQEESSSQGGSRQGGVGASGGRTRRGEGGRREIERA